MRKFFQWLEEWIFNDDSFFLSAGKLLLTVAVAIFVVVSAIATIVNIVNPHEHAVLDLTTDWTCTSTHTELQRVMHGKISRLEDVVVCDNYRKR